MKQKFLFGLLSLLVCMFTMTACSNDDDNNNGGGDVKSGLKLASVDWGNDGKDGDTGGKHTFTYDQQGRVKMDVYNEVHGITELYHYDYQEDKIVVTITEANSQSSKMEFILKDGLVVELRDYYGNDYYTYDKDKQLIGVKTSNFETSIVWKNGNMVSCTTKDNYGNDTYTYEYTSELAVKSFIHVSDFCIEGLEEADVLFNMGYFGKQPKNLLASVTGSDGTSYAHSYKFEGKDNYVSEWTVTGKSKTNTRKLTWE